MNENPLHRLRSVDLDFLVDAPVRFTYEVELPAPVEVVFAAISADPSTWTWFPGLADGRYASPPPHGVGTKRAIALEGTVYRETILAWDAPHRWAYRVDETTDPTFLALAEDWVITPAPDEGSRAGARGGEPARSEPHEGHDAEERERRAHKGGSALRWTFAVEPQAELAELIAGAGEMIGTVFANAMVSLSDHLRATAG